MIKLDIINEVVNRTGITKTKAEMAVETVFESMKRALEQGDRIELRGFGVFNVKPRKTGHDAGKGRVKNWQPFFFFVNGQDNIDCHWRRGVQRSRGRRFNVRRSASILTIRGAKLMSFAGRREMAPSAPSQMSVELAKYLR